MLGGNNPVFSPPFPRLSPILTSYCINVQIKDLTETALVKDRIFPITTHAGSPGHCNTARARTGCPGNGNRHVEVEGYCTGACGSGSPSHNEARDKSRSRSSRSNRRQLTKSVNKCEQ